MWATEKHRDRGNKDVNNVALPSALLLLPVESL